MVQAAYAKQLLGSPTLLSSLHPLGSSLLASLLWTLFFSPLYLRIPSSPSLLSTFTIILFFPQAFFTCVLFLSPFAISCLASTAVCVQGGWRRAVAVWMPKIHRRQHRQTLARLKLPSLNTSFCTKATMQKVAFNDSSTKPLEHFYVEICVGLCEGLRSLSNLLFMGPQLETDFFHHPCSITCFYCATLADLFPSAYLDLRKLFAAASLWKMMHFWFFEELQLKIRALIFLHDSWLHSARQGHR